MPKRKRYPKLPNGYGSIKYLGKGRRNPYAVHPPVKEFQLNGSPVTPKALCYTDTWIKGFTILTAYKAGTYYPGMELELNLEEESSENIESLVQKILADYNATRPVEKAKREQEKTFEDVYREYFKWKFENEKGHSYSKNTVNATISAFKRCADLHSRIFSELKYDDLQNHLDNSTLSHAALELDINLIKQMYKYALICEYTGRNPSQFLKISKEDDDIPGEPFSGEDLKKLWAHKSDPTVEFLLIMCYSGYRITAYRTLEVHLPEGYFKGGIKTKCSKDRIVPIHSAIRPLVEARVKRQGAMLLNTTPYVFRTAMYKTLKELSIKHHTPHDCRHTFSMLCEKYGVKENDRKRMMGHSFGSDITNAKYGHRSLDDLKTEIEKIKVE